MLTPVRYAVVGLGSFAQLAILPGFKNAENSRLVAFVSDDPKKAKILSQRYKVSHFYSYDEYDACLQSGMIDAVSIALPNSMHKEYAVRAAHAGIHVLCEKPLASSEKECEEMIAAADRHGIILMTAYRLHFEDANLSIIDFIRKGTIGKPRYFSSCFSHQVRAGDIRTRRHVGGGGLWDLGVYCVNASRYIFRDEPIEVFAVTTNSDAKRFKGVDEMASVILRFSEDRLAQFTTSQGAADISQYKVVGTKGIIDADPSYEYAGGMKYTVTIGTKKKSYRTPKRDQVAAEIIYFSACVQKDRPPEPSGREGLLDVRIIEALYRSARIGRPIRLRHLEKSRRPKGSQKINRPGHDAPELVNAQRPSR